MKSAFFEKKKVPLKNAPKSTFLKTKWAKTVAYTTPLYIKTINCGHLKKKSCYMSKMVIYSLMGTKGVSCEDPNFFPNAKFIKQSVLVLNHNSGQNYLPRKYVFFEFFIDTGS